MTELILVIKLCMYFILFLVACGVVLLIALIIYAIKYFRKEKENGAKEV